MLIPCFFHPFCRSHTSTACSFLHCKGQLSKPWLDILLYQDKKKFNKQTNEPLRQKKDPKRNNQVPYEERVEMQKFTWRIHASRRKKMICFFHTYSILFSTGDKIYWWWRPQIMWRKLVFPCFFYAFKWKKYTYEKWVQKACFPQFFHTFLEFSQFYSTFLSL